MTKPPIGIMPRKLWLEERVYDLGESIRRRISASHYVPIEWVTEYNKLLKEVKE